MVGEQTVLQIDPGLNVTMHVPTTTSESWTAVYGFADDDVWIGSLSGLAHWNGVAWVDQRSTTEPIGGLWGTSSGDLWAVGWNGLIMHRVGSTWTTLTSVTTEDLAAVWGSGASDVWAVGAAGTVLHFAGSAWQPVSSGVTDDLRTVWGSSAGVYIGGGTGTLLHGSGATLTPVNHGLGVFSFSVIAGTSDSDVWAVGILGALAHFDGTSWTRTTGVTSNALYGLSVSASERWAVGAQGEILRHDGSGWHELSHEFPVEFRGAWRPPGQDELWLTTAEFPGRVLRKQGGVWTATVANPTGFGLLSALWGPSTSDVWAVGQDGILHFDGAAWSMSMPSNAWVTGVHGSAATAVWAVGDGGAIFFWDGVQWTPQSSGTTARLEGVWANSATDVYAVGRNVALHFDGAAWSPVSTGLSSYIFGVVGFGPTDVWVAGLGGYSHYTGSSWLTGSPGIAGYATDLWGPSPSAVYAVGPRRSYAWNGTSVTALPQPMVAAQRIRGVGTGLCVAGSGLVCQP